MNDESGAAFESPDQALKESGGTPDANKVKMWLAAWKAADTEEEKWRRRGDEVIGIYRSEKGDSSTESQTYFNIVHSNIETTLPAIYNSTPLPDIRRRYNDPGKVAKDVADLLERALSYSVDNYDFDGTMRNVLFDGYTPGRGCARVRYVPYFEGEGDTETVAHEEASCEYVYWKDFRRGPGRVWEDVSWIGYQLFLDRAELKKLCGDKRGAIIPLDCSVNNEDTDEDEQSGPPKGEIFGRARVYEIWDKSTKKVFFIAPGFKSGPIAELDDPLELQNFFPSPRPVQPVLTPGNLVPVAPYEAYRKLSESLNNVRRRIDRLVKQMRVRGLYGAAQTDIENVLTADDGELKPVVSFEQFMASGGDLNKAIAWWPLEPSVKAVMQLRVEEEALKTTIYEVTGLSDILRGSTQASETATAQQLKSQWGALRIQRMQADVARFARDLFRMKAEVIAAKFSMQTLMLMTGVELVPEAVKQQAQQQVQMMQQQAAMQSQQAGGPQQAPPPIPEEIQKVLESSTIEEVEKILRSDLLRSYKIDIESDSTVRADLTRDKGEMSEFMQATGGFVSAVGPAVQAGVIPKDLALEVYGAFCRLFRLGKSAEDSLERASTAIRKEAQNPPPPKPDPEMAKVEAEAQAAQQKQQADMQAKQAELQMDMQKMQAELQMKREEMEAKLNLEREKMQLEHQQKMQLAESEHALKADMANKDHELKRDVAEGGMLLEENKVNDTNSARRKLKKQTDDIKSLTGERDEIKERAEFAESAVHDMHEHRKKPKTIVRKGGRITGVKVGDVTIEITRDKSGRIAGLKQ